MDMQPRKSLAELEKIYAGNRTVSTKPDLEFGDLKIGKDEFKTKIEPENFQKDIELGDVYYNDKPAISNKKGDLIEIKTFLPTFAEKMISSRYENPLKDLKISTKRWKVLTILLALLSFAYFAVHLWATLTLTNVEVLSKAPRALLQVSSMLIKMQDLLSSNNTLNIALDCWALVIYSVLIVKLLSETSTKITSDEEEQGRLRRIISGIVILAVILFALSYISGTIMMILYINANPTAAMIGMIVFHVLKLSYLILNFIAMRTYKSKKFIYEDLLLEALGPSDSGDDRSEEDNPGNFENNYLP